MFTIHLTPNKYRAAVMAAQMAGDDDRIHVGYESPPNVNVGDEVEVRVEGIAPQIGVVEKIRPAVNGGEYPPMREMFDRLRDEAMKREFAARFGVPLEVLNRGGDEHWEGMKATHWLILRHKGSAAAPSNAV